MSWYNLLSLSPFVVTGRMWTCENCQLFITKKEERCMASDYVVLCEECYIDLEVNNK